MSKIFESVVSRVPVWVSVLLMIAAASASFAEGESESVEDPAFYRGVPSANDDRSVAAFTDLGSWHGYSIPPQQEVDLRGAFVGPLLHSEGRWLARTLAQLHLIVDGEAVEPGDYRDFETVSKPGSLGQTFGAGSVDVKLTLFFPTPETAAVQLSMTCGGQDSCSVEPSWRSAPLFDESAVQAKGGSMVFPTPREDRVTWQVVGGSVSAKDGAAVARLAARQIASGKRDVSWSLITLGDGQPDVAEPDQALQRQRARWQGYLESIDTGLGDDHPHQILAVKALRTLVGNWRAPRGGLQHDGLFPSAAVWYFNGFWAWDSWKHAVAIARFDIELAKNQVRTMYDHQNERGMIADVVYVNPDGDNWRDTKPPLSGWAIEEVFGADGDLEFVRELYPHLVRYHRWWYHDRDHDGDGLCEYGSTDGTIVAARWESGMDNAPRFDDAEMLENRDGAWSMNRESVDLNAYLYREKIALSRLATALGNEDEAAEWQAQAEALAIKIRETFWNEELGWYVDVEIGGEKTARQGPEGWTPLWAGVATAEQAARARKTMLNPKKFLTHVPFPTIAADDPEFSDGYWRGLVWIDQVYFGIEALRRYGFDDDAERVTRQLFQNLDGAIKPGIPLHENYHPLTGERRNAPHFSWTSAHLLLLTQDR
ncbi:MAG: glycoside hydrolase [Thermoanaerobaculia bacterium]|nr:glycoside hydrolase [Thermoanaerobaculia bacterium]